MTDLIKFRDVEPLDAGALADWMDTAYYALSKLRSGELHLDGSRDQRTLNAIYTGINDLSVRLLPRLQGIVDALVRAHYDAGGTHGELARAMDVDSRSTAQTRGDKIRKARPTVWELWATGELEPERIRAADVRPGWALVVGDQHMQVSRVVHYVDYGHVQIHTKGGSNTYSAGSEVNVVRRDVPVTTTEGTETMPDGDVWTVRIHQRAAADDPHRPTA